MHIVKHRPKTIWDLFPEYSSAVNLYFRICTNGSTRDKTTLPTFHHKRAICSQLHLQKVWLKAATRHTTEGVAESGHQTHDRSSLNERAVIKYHLDYYRL